MHTATQAELSILQAKTAHPIRESRCSRSVGAIAAKRRGSIVLSAYLQGRKRAAGVVAIDHEAWGPGSAPAAAPAMRQWLGGEPFRYPQVRQAQQGRNSAGGEPYCGPSTYMSRMADPTSSCQSCMAPRNTSGSVQSGCALSSVASTPRQVDPDAAMWGKACGSARVAGSARQLGWQAAPNGAVRQPAVHHRGARHQHPAHWPGRAVGGRTCWYLARCRCASQQTAPSAGSRERQLAMNTTQCRPLGTSPGSNTQVQAGQRQQRRGRLDLVVH